MKPTLRVLTEYLRERYGISRDGLSITLLGKGSHGQGFMASFLRDGIEQRIIVKRLDPSIGLGHDYPSDRAAVFLQALDSYGRLPRHVKALDVIAEGAGGRVFPIGGGREYYLLMEEGQGRSYFEDLAGMGGHASLGDTGRARIAALAGYLARIHSKKKDAPRLYLRKLRDTVGGGECLMGVLDTYGGTYGGTYNGASFTTPAEMEAIEKACVTWRYRLRPGTGRLCVTHGDFHPGNILLTPGRAVVIDWIDASLGNPLADVARTTVIALGAAASSQVPNAALKFFLRLFHTVYLRCYFQLLPGGEAEYRRWLPVVAAARLSENIPELEHWLVEQAQEGLQGS